MHRWVPGACACAWLMAFADSSAQSPVDAPGSDYSFVSDDYLRGVAALDGGRYGEAVASLQRAVAAQPDFSGARIELARAQFASGKYPEAREEFQYLLTQSPPEQTRSVIQRYLDAIPGRRLFATSRWSGMAQLGAGYDSNANGSTSDPSFLGFTLNPRNVETDSSFGELTLGGAHSLSLSPAVGLVTNAQLTHRANSDASFVDQSVVTLGSALVWSRGEYRFSGGVDGYAGWLDLEGYERGLNFNASASRRFGDYEGAASVRVGSLEYQQPSLGIMDADRILTGLSVARAMGRGVRAGIALIAGTDDAKQAGSPYGNDRFGARLFGAWQLRPDSAVHAELSNLSTDFDGSFFGSRRKDTQLGLTVSLDLQDFPASGWSIAPRLRYLDNHSNISLYEYDRFEAMVFVRRSFQGKGRGGGTLRGRYATQTAEAGEGATAKRVVDSAEIGIEAEPTIGTTPAKPEQSISATSPLGLVVDITNPHLPGHPQISVAVSTPASTVPAFAASSTERRETFEFNGSGNLLQFNELFGTGSNADKATYLSGTAATVDFGSNGASGIRWGRWSTGSASINTVAGVQPINLRNASLHWIAGPIFEASPMLPVSGSTHFVLAGGTSPTDNFGHVGSLADAVLTADFTAQQVRAELSLDINGYNWFATGNGTLSIGATRFAGTFNNVLVDGRVPGGGAFSGFLSAGPLSPDQLNGAGLSYWLSGGGPNSGTISGVAAFVPGAVQPLAPPLVQRDVAWSSGNVDGTSIVGGAAANSRAQLSIDANGNLRRFQAPVPHATSGTLAVGVSSATDTGADTATGMRWGRWEGGTVNVTTPPGTAVSNDFLDKSLHWIAGNEFGAPPILPQTGTATYALIGNTRPTDTRGHAGSMGVANFHVNFTDRIVTSQMTLNVGGIEWYASGSGTFPIGGHRIVGSYDDVRIQNIARGQGMMYGFFTMPRLDSGTKPGVGLSFSLTDNAGELGVISGVLAFAEGGQSGVVTPPAPGQRDIAFVSPDFAANSTFVQRAQLADYALDSHFSLTSLPGPSNSNLAEPARYDVGTSAIAESDVSPLVMMRWGRWAGGSANSANLVTGVSHTIDLSHQSLHWIEGADSVAPPVMPQLGTATYALMGATAPTDRSGHTGAIHNATLSADFTNQFVSASLDVTVNNINVVATGGGPIGALGGLPAHQFTGVINGGAISTTQGTPQGTFSGFFSAPGGTTPGVPGGAGLTYSITDGQGLFVIDGAAAFRAP